MNYWFLMSILINNKTQSIQKLYTNDYALFIIFNYCIHDLQMIRDCFHTQWINLGGRNIKWNISDESNQIILYDLYTLCYCFINLYLEDGVLIYIYKMRSTSRMHPVSFHNVNSPQRGDTCTLRSSMSYANFIHT